MSFTEHSGGGRTSTSAARLGFRDFDRVVGFLNDLRLTSNGQFVDAQAERVVRTLAAAGDPDLAVLNLLRLSEFRGGGEVVTELKSDKSFCGRLVAVLGASRALGDWLCATEGAWRILLERPDPADLVRQLATCVGADLDDPVTGSAGKAATTTGVEAVRLLKVAYRRCIFELAARDLTGELEMEQVADHLSLLAGALVQVGLAVALAEMGDRVSGVRLAVIGMGKCGAEELNYVSDVDVVYVAEPLEGTSEDDALRCASWIATSMMRVCGEVAWQVDAALRPEGKAGQLVRTLDGHRSYYARWARTWEFQALLKARAIAGDLDLGGQYERDIASQAWTAADRDGFVDDVQAMRRRVEEHLSDAVARRELKLGPGGLRDVEFAVQLLQLVHGRVDESIRKQATLESLAALSEGGYIGREDATSLAASYRFLRTVEHRLMLQRLRRTHMMPDTEPELRWLARTLGFMAGPKGDEIKALDSARSAHAREVRRLHEKLFYRPLLSAVAAVPGDELRLTPAAAASRLAALGFARPDGALKHVQALIAGTSRTAAMQRMLLPAMLSMFADAADPDSGLLAYRQVSEQLGNTPWYLRFLRDEGAVAERLAHVLGSSKYVAGLLGRAPEAIRMLADLSDLEPRPEVVIESKMRLASTRNADAAAAVASTRSLRRHELLRVACADLLDLVTLSKVGRALSAIADATICATLEIAISEIEADVGDLPCKISVIGMGRLGGHEMAYGSDADVVYVFDAVPGADDELATRAALRVVERLGRLLATPGPDPALIIDTGLRPEGKKGPLVRSLAGYAEYYARWSASWESQALLRARPIGGDPVLGARFIEMADAIRYPEGGLSEDDLREIRRIKARVDAERLPRGADPTRHTKLGPGGLADVEWTVQLLQLQNAARLPALRTTSTLEALNEAKIAGLIAADDAAALEGAWRLASRCRNAIMLIKNKAGDELPKSGRELAALARILGYPPSSDTGRFLDNYRRATRRAHAVAERLFFGRE